MAARITVIDLFGLLEHRKPSIEAMDILQGKKPLFPLEVLWWFKIHPSQGPATGFSNAAGGGRARQGIPGGSTLHPPPGTFIRPS